MRQNHDPFPSTPAGFHLRVEETLMGLEENEVKYVRKYSLKVIAVAAAIIMLLAATAVGVVQGRHLLRDSVNDRQGTENTSDYVQDVHAEAGKNGFNLCVDEYVSYSHGFFDMSYTIAVPDDGNTYLYALYEPSVNGAKMDMESGAFYDMNASDSATMYAIGGKFGTSYSDVLDGLYTPGVSRGREDSLLETEDAAGNAREGGDVVTLKVAILKTDLPIRCYSGVDERKALMENRSYANQQGVSTSAWPTYRESGVLYTSDVYQERGELPGFDMLEYREVLETVIPNMSDWPGGYINPTMEELVAAGIGDLVEVLEVSFVIDWLDAPHFEG